MIIYCIYNDSWQIFACRNDFYMLFLILKPRCLFDFCKCLYKKLVSFYHDWQYNIQIITTQYLYFHDFYTRLLRIYVIGDTFAITRCKNKVYSLQLNHNELKIQIRVFICFIYFNDTSNHCVHIWPLLCVTMQLILTPCLSILYSVYFSDKTLPPLFIFRRMHQFTFIHNLMCLIDSILVYEK